MTNKERYFDIELNKDEIAHLVKKTFNTEHRELMTECLMDLLRDDTSGLKALCKASMGITPQIDYVVGDRVIVQMLALSDWQFDKDKMQEAGMLKDGCVEVTIESIQKFNHTPYTVMYRFIHKDTGEDRSTTNSVSSSYVTGYADEFPGDDGKLLSLPEEPLNL